jgi:hypothetical protein
LLFIATILALTFAKLSVLHLYLRLFSLKRSFRATIWTVYGINVGWAACFSASYLWKSTSTYYIQLTPPKECIQASQIFDQAFMLSDVMLDVVVLILPLPAVWSLSLDTRQKAITSFMLLLGTL